MLLVVLFGRNLQPGMRLHLMGVLCIIWGNQNIKPNQNMKTKIVQLFLRWAISLGILTVVADRFGIWPGDRFTRGHWGAFLKILHRLTLGCQSQLFSF